MLTIGVHQKYLVSTEIQERLEQRQSFHLEYGSGNYIGGVTSGGAAVDDVHERDADESGSLNHAFDEIERFVSIGTVSAAAATVSVTQDENSHQRVVEQRSFRRNAYLR